MGMNSPCIGIAHSPSALFQHPHQRNLANPRFLPHQQQRQVMEAPRVSLKRKQSIDNDSPMPSSGPPSPSSSEGTHNINANSQVEYAKIKRTKTSAEIVSRTKTVSKLIATLNVPQLVNLINTMVESHPSLADEIAGLVPRPTVSSVQTLLTSLETKLRESYPYTKWGPGTDDYSYNRVKPALEELVETLIDYTTHFTTPPEFPTTSFSFLHIATDACHRLPRWDSPANNELKAEVYKKLAQFWTKAIVDAASKLEEGKIYGQATVQEWASNLEQHNITSQGMFSHPIEEFKAKLGWIIGIQAPPTPFSTESASSPATHVNHFNNSTNSNNRNSNTGNNNNNNLNANNGNNINTNGIGMNRVASGAGSPFHAQIRHHQPNVNAFHSRR